MRYLVDTNVLLRLLQRNDPNYSTIRKVVLTLLRRGDELCCAPQNIVEFWNVCTMPSSSRGGCCGNRRAFGVPPRNHVAGINGDFKRL